MCLIFSVLVYIYKKRSKRKYGNNIELNARIVFFKHKWKMHHIKTVCAFILGVLAMVAVGIATQLAVIIYLAGLTFLASYIYLYNKMMIYVEKKAFG
ncbi:MAG: hypothetical protein IKS48_03825 [Eubacterium sp.]|nr:hypothetical protein [Eubacterium sp.]